MYSIEYIIIFYRVDSKVILVYNKYKISKRIEEFVMWIKAIFCTEDTVYAERLAHFFDK